MTLRKRNFQRARREMARPGSRGGLRRSGGAAEEAKPIVRRSRNSPDVCRGLEFDANVIEFARAAGKVNGFDLSADGASFFADGGLSNLQGNPRTDVAVVAGRIAAAVEIEAHGGRAFEEFLAETVLAGDQQRDGALDAGAAARFDAGGAARGIDQS